MRLKGNKLLQLVFALGFFFWLSVKVFLFFDLGGSCSAMLRAYVCRFHSWWYFRVLTCGYGHQTHVGHVQGRYLTYSTLSSPTKISFLKYPEFVVCVFFFFSLHRRHILLLIPVIMIPFRGISGQDTFGY